MPKRIPHTDMEVITGEKATQDCLKMQKILFSGGVVLCKNSTWTYFSSGIKAL